MADIETAKLKKGLFITAEGIDGSGKSTQIRIMADWLSRLGLDPIITREPGGTPFGEKIREIILDPQNEGICSTSELLLCAAARAQLVEEILKPVISLGRIIICDRYTDSTTAYQAYGRGLDASLVKYLNITATGGLAPDITLYFDISPAEALTRRSAPHTSGNPDRPEGTDRIESEGMAFHTKVYEGYHKIAANDPDRIKVIDAHKTVDEIAEEVKNLLVPLLASKGYLW